ncbi:MAG TPA: GntR family transcriptional regulator [Pyrinomonadaceae bacterium]|jgi:GntR family transcriptional regulator|nr:GntR family transcriptional regulator [Pyrinomonadaceae bacterium]
MSEIFTVSPSHPMPLYAQLTRAIRFAIATGRLRVGEQLPTVRQLAVELRVNANTVARVYAELERTGILETRRGVGTFVSARQFAISHRQEHEKHINELVDRFLEEACAMGFSIDDVLEQLQSRCKKETKNVYESDGNQE